MVKIFLAAGSLLMFLGVGAGAFGAHGLSAYFEQYPRLEGTFDTAVRYHMIHALGVLFLALLARQWPSGWVVGAGWLFIAGIFLFSGSLYLLVFTRVGWLGAITPLGGLAFLSGWLALFIAALRVV